MLINFRTSFRLAIVGSLFIIHGVANAQTMEKALIMPEPLQYTKHGNFEGCGLHLRLLEDNGTQSLNNQTLNYATLSINFYTKNPNVAVLKTSFSRATFTNNLPVSKKKKIDSTWVRLSESEPLQIMKTIAGDEDAILGLSNAEEALTFLGKMLTSNPQLQLGLRESGNSFERIMYGTVVIKDQDKQAIMECLAELIKRADLKK